MASPPIVPGVTQIPRTRDNSLSSLLSALMGGSQRQEGPALIDLREGRAAFQRAAASDPRIAERIRAALDLIEGRESDMPRQQKPSPRMGPRFNAHTPI